MKYVIVSRKDEKSEAMKEEIKNKLSNFNDFNYDEATPELVIVVGGDGTYLHAVHQYLDNLDKIAFIGVHTGTLGFICDYCDQEVDELIKDITTKEMHIIDTSMLCASVDNKKVYSLNEIRIENPSRTQKIDVYIDGNLFETFRGTGLIISTQLGSTAYNRSLGGSIVAEGLETIQLGEIAGIHHRAYHSLGSSIIFGKETKIKLVSDNYDGALLCYDAYCENLAAKKEVEVYLSNKIVRHARYKEVSYLERLKDLY